MIAVDLLSHLMEAFSELFLKYESKFKIWWGIIQVIMELWKNIFDVKMADL